MKRILIAVAILAVSLALTGVILVGARLATVEGSTVTLSSHIAGLEAINASARLYALEEDSHPNMVAELEERLLLTQLAVVVEDTHLTVLKAAVRFTLYGNPADLSIVGQLLNDLNGEFRQALDIYVAAPAGNATEEAWYTLLRMLAT